MYIYIYNRTLFGHKKEGNPAICVNMDGPWGHHAKWNVRCKKTILFDVTYMWNLKKPNAQKQRVDWWLSEAKGWEKWGDVGQRVQISR